MVYFRVHPQKISLTHAHDGGFVELGVPHHAYKLNSHNVGDAGPLPCPHCGEQQPSRLVLNMHSRWETSGTYAAIFCHTSLNLLTHGNLRPQVL